MRWQEDIHDFMVTYLGVEQTLKKTVLLLKLMMQIKGTYIYYIICSTSVGFTFFFKGI